MKITNLTIEQFRFLIEEIIDQKFMEYLGDPDEGLELRPEIIKRLKAHKRSKSKRIKLEV
jgi:hypothetical protein